MPLANKYKRHDTAIGVLGDLYDKLEQVCSYMENCFPDTAERDWLDDFRERVKAEMYDRQDKWDAEGYEGEEEEEL